MADAVEIGKVRTIGPNGDDLTVYDCAMVITCTRDEIREAMETGCINFTVLGMPAPEGRGGE